MGYDGLGELECGGYECMNMVPEGDHKFVKIREFGSCVITYQENLIGLNNNIRRPDASG